MAVAKISDGDARKITTLLRVLDKLREVNPEIPLTQIIALLGAALHGPITLKELCNKLDITISTGSRAMHILAGRSIKKGPPMDAVVDYYTNPQNFKEKLIELTPAGRRLVMALCNHL